MLKEREDRLYVLTEKQSFLILGIFFTLLGVVLLLFIIPSQIKYSGSDFPGPATLPNAYAAIMGIIGLFMIGQSIMLRNKPVNEEKNVTFSRNSVLKSLLALAILVVNLVGLVFFTYLPVTMVTLFVLMFLFGQRNKITLVAVSVGLPLIVYYGFTVGLKLVLP